MSRTATLVFICAIGLPVLAFIAAAAGTDGALLSGGVTFFVVVTAVVAMLFEIKRLADDPAGSSHA
ncbi:MAG TPA: hypothetical protein VGU24_03025 [Microvirga sp.]|jgi:hypothetical protein|nr:hypothetical protein [Microvirga sp.]